MKKRDFLNAVEKEVISLKIHATKKELKKVVFNKIKSFNVYQKLTGKCDSDRAEELMEKSCVKTFSANPLELKKESFTNVKHLLFNSNNEATWKGSSASYDRNISFLSALEGYVCMKGAKNNHIAMFLRGEIKILSL